jgi:hypothetical protein
MKYKGLIMDKFLIEDLLCCRHPVAGKKFIELVNRMRRNPGENIAQPLKRIDVVDFASAQERI